MSTDNSKNKTKLMKEERMTYVKTNETILTEEGEEGIYVRDNRF